MLTSICDSQYEKQTKNDMWIRSLYKKVNELKLDYVGKVGELLVKQICETSYIPFVYNEDVNTSHKTETFDMLIFDRRVEIKTARIGKTKTFQHENLRNKECDYYIFVDIAPDSVYLTILQSFDMTQKCNFCGRIPHLRKGASNIFKFDFTPKTIQSYIKNELCICINSDTLLTEVGSFIHDKLFHNQ